MSTNYSPTIVTDGAVFVGDALMPSTATSATTLYDRVGGNNGTMYCGSCLDFDGTDDYITMSDIDSEFSDYFTLSVWLKPGGVTGDTWIFAGENGGGIGFYFRQSSDDIIFRHNGIGDGTTVVSNIFDTNWAHYVLNWDGVNTNVYKDGVRVGGEAATGTLAADAFNGPRIGDDSAAADREWDGAMADFRLYNVALSASQVTEIYNDSKVIIPSNISQTNLIVWYPMVDGAGAVAYDGSGNGYDGTLPNGPTWTTGQTGAPQLVEGYNRPMWFDDSDEEVVVGSKAAINFIGTDNFSLSAWVWLDTNTSFDTVIGKSYGDFRLCANAAQLAFRTNSNNVIAAGGTMGTKQWYHVVGTWATNGSGGGTAKAYLNGAEVGSATGSYSWTSTGNSFKIGNSSTESHYWKGLINECIAYNKTLSLAEVRVLAARANTSYSDTSRGPLPPNPMALSDSANVVGYWRNDGDVTWTDRSGNGNTGTAIGSPDALLFKQGYNGSASTSTGRDNQGFPLSRQNNGAIGFDGSTNYTDVGSVGGAGTFSNCTISVWVNPQNNGGAVDYGRIYDGNYEPSIRQRGPTLQLNGAVAASQTYLFYLGADISNYFSSGNMTVPKGQWTNITMTVVTVGTASQTVVGYVNLNPEGSGSTTDSAKMWVGDIGNLRIGQGYKTGQRFFAGQIANLQIWNRALSLPEITQNYKAQRSRFT